MRLFYLFLLAWSEFDLQVARSTGRNPDHVAILAQDVERWRLALWRESVSAQ